MNKKQQEIVEILQKKMTSKNIGFFSNLVAYKMSQLATNMNATVTYVGGEKIPVNTYCLNLANSGFSKGKSLKFLESKIFSNFKESFTTGTFIDRTRLIVEAQADINALASGKDAKYETQKIWKAITDLPTYVYTFGSGTTPEGLKGLMTALSIRESGAVSIEIDEIGSNISSNKEVLDTLLESYDGGLIKNKLKRTDSNSEIENPVPTNLMAFGTPSKLFDGGASEEQLMSFLDTGYARRFLFGYVHEDMEVMDASDKMLSLMDKTVDTDADDMNNYLKSLALLSNHSQESILSDEANVALFEYEEKCLKQASVMKSYQEIEKTEMSHRYFKALKLSGVYAFIEGSTTVTKEMIEDAIELVELSGKAFAKMMSREKNYVRLAKYIAEQGDSPVTLADLTHDLSGFFKGSEAAKRDMLTLAKSWSASNDIIIKESFVGDIQYFTGETIKQTSLDSLIVSVSTEMTTGYIPHYSKWEAFQKLCENDFNFCTHHFKDKYRDGAHMLPETNLLVLDIDDGISMKIAMKLMEDYEFLAYTTKRHTEHHNRFRMLLPMEKTLKLNEQDHKDFYTNVFASLPFEVDEQTADGPRKWQTYKNSEIHTNKGKLFNPMPYIQNTTKAKEQTAKINSFGPDVSRLEKHILMNTDGRNNALLKIGMVHVERGLDYDTIYQLIVSTNNKLLEPISEKEILGTVMVTVGKKIAKRSSE